MLNTVIPVVTILFVLPVLGACIGRVWLRFDKSIAPDS